MSEVDQLVATIETLETIGISSGQARKASNSQLVVNPGWGFFCAIAAQLVWGAFPFFYSFLRSIDAFQLVAHRAIWGFGFVSIWMAYYWLWPGANRQPIREFLSVFGNRRLLLLVTLATVLIGFNWFVFVWAVTSGRALEASLGYYICPQVNVLMGVFILGERLSRGQQMAVLLSALGVLHLTSFSTGFPWVSLLMASIFGTYGLVKKTLPINAISSLFIETAGLLIPSLGVLLFLNWGGIAAEGTIPGYSWSTWGLLVLSGLMTVAPLALYGTALRHIPLSTVGLLQFIGPTLQFLSGIYLLGEPFDKSRLIGFILVWSGLAVFIWATRVASLRKPLPPPRHDRNTSKPV